MMTGAKPLVAAAILTMGLGAACTRDDRAAANRNADGTLSASPSPSPYDTAAVDRDDDETITAGDVAANPTKYVGQRVAVKGDVADIVSSSSFTLDEDRLGADQNLLVLSQSGVPSQEHKNEKVTVSGRVVMFSTSEIKRDYDWFQPTPEIETKFRNRPVIIADSVRTADGRDLTMGSSALPAGSGEIGHGNQPAGSKDKDDDRPRP